MEKQIYIYGSVSKKCLYALRSVFELTLRGNGRPVKVHEIAQAQDIPLRFLEVILNQLSHGGFVQSWRGKNGGYQLARDPLRLTVGEIIRFLQGTSGIAKDNEEKSYSKIAKSGDYAFAQIWEKVAQAESKIYDSTTFSELVEKELDINKVYALNYSI